jgi:hypothetical protein
MAAKALSVASGDVLRAANLAASSSLKSPPAINDCRSWLSNNAMLLRYGDELSSTGLWKGRAGLAAGVRPKPLVQVAGGEAPGGAPFRPFCGGCTGCAVDGCDIARAPRLRLLIRSFHAEDRPQRPTSGGFLVEF